MPADAAPSSNAWLAQTVDAAGYESQDAVVVAAASTTLGQVHLSRGRTRAGVAVDSDALIYTASLSKQVTAGCAAVLAGRGALDARDPLRRWLPEMPSWADTVAVGDLIHHTSGLPDVLSFAELREHGQDRTSGGVLQALAQVEHLPEPPGTLHRYCNAGYVALGAVVERAADQPFADVAAQLVFTPLGMSRSRYWSGPGSHPPGAVPTEVGVPAALSLGDGGMWSTARDLLRWNDAVNGDELGVTATLNTPGRLRDRTVLDYAWGVGVRAHAGERIYRHGGSWAGVSAQLVRVPGRGGGAVVLALDDGGDRTIALANTLVAHLAA